MITGTKKIVASESCHWYTQDGEPCYEVPRSKGDGMRPTTLRDAKKLGLVPSVTTVLSIIAKPGLDSWKQNQILLSAATSPHSMDDLNKWVELVIRDAKEQSEKAMQLGTDIHGAIEKYVNGEIAGIHREYVWPVITEMQRRGIYDDGKPERSFAHPIGFGGKIDFHNDEWVIDFKTKEFTGKDIIEKKQLAWPEHIYQLGAYRYGIGKPHLKCMNIFISTSVPGLYHSHEWTGDEAKKGTEIFLATLELWKKIKRTQGA